MLHCSRLRRRRIAPSPPRPSLTATASASRCRCVRRRSNRSLALLRLNKLPKALADAEQCTKLDPANVKGWYRRAQVLETQGHIEQVRARLWLPARALVAAARPARARVGAGVRRYMC